MYLAAIDSYLPALWLLADSSAPGRVVACLNGLGLAYQALARETLGDELRAAIGQAQTRPRSAAAITTVVYRAQRGRGGDLAQRARACHARALEVQKSIGHVAGQAGQLSNLALVEAMLGNVDTAIGYQEWALLVHRATRKRADAEIDRTNLIDLARRFGDDERAETFAARA